MAISTSTYKGARDFYPSDKREQNYIFKVWRETVESFGYEEYDAPIIEPIELYLAKTSEEIVNEQTYSFQDRGGRQVTLRPEMTPTVSRMVAARRQELPLPLRWYSIPNLWRYERPQKGRLREHWQLNVDLFGVSGLEAEHEIIEVVSSIMQRFGANQDTYIIRINSRKLINDILRDYIKLDENQANSAIRLIDRQNKIEKDEFKQLVSEIAGDKTNDLLNIFSINNLNQLSSDLQEHQSVKELHQLLMMLARSGITNAVFDIGLMRGFDYYTDIVFEIFDTNPENSRALFGGGRYDGLVGLFGVEPIATIGFGMGDVTMKDFLLTHNLMPEQATGVDLEVILIGDVFLEAQDVIKSLRLKGLKVAVDHTKRKIDKQLKMADKAGYKYILFIGENELANNKYNLKELSTGQEQVVDEDEIVSIILK